jgi:glycosyltransferase involved in cell wall biosynthesis
MTPTTSSAPTPSQPRITVITPSFNHARFLRQCIDSVLAQNYPNLQYIVIDGGSIDGTLDILHSYGDRIQWKSEPDRGQADAVNKGVRLAEGEIIGWLNSDDYYLPGALARVVECFAQHPDSAMIYGRALMVEEDGQTRREYPAFRFRRKHLARKCYVCQPAVFVRRQVLQQVGPLNTALDICLDYEWWLRIGRQHSLGFCDHLLAGSRHYSSTKTAARRLRALVEAGYLMREHFGRASWRWSAKWVVHRWMLDHRRFWFPVIGWIAAMRSAIRFRQRFDARREPSAYGRRMIERLRVPPRPAAPS